MAGGPGESDGKRIKKSPNSVIRIDEMVPSPNFIALYSHADLIRQHASPRSDKVL